MSPKINLLQNVVKQHVLEERQSAKYYAIIVDSTPDSSHDEQTIRANNHFALPCPPVITICYCGTVSEIAQMVTETSENHAIPLAEGYDNPANMSGKYNSAQAIIKEQFPTAIFSHCGCHTITLCGNDAAESHSNNQE